MTERTDRELLELAAEAAGYKLDGLASKHIAQGVGADDLLRLNEQGGHSVWNPLTDDGDALRLAVKLSIVVAPYVSYAMADSQHEDAKGDIAAATRRAIVRAAAEIGAKE